MVSQAAPSGPKIVNELKKLAKQNHAELSFIHPTDIEVRNWVRWKCQFGCKGYGKHLSCPPYVPGPSETRALLQSISICSISLRILRRLCRRGVQGHR